MGRADDLGAVPLKALMNRKGVIGQGIAVLLERV